MRWRRFRLLAPPSVGVPSEYWGYSSAAPQGVARPSGQAHRPRKTPQDQRLPARCAVEVSVFGRASREAFYPEIAFGGFSDADPTVAFYTRVQALLKPSFVVVDVGCGRGFHAHDAVVYRRKLQDLRANCRRVIGIDIEEPASRNPLIDEFRLVDGRCWPLEDESVDLCISQNVLEHLEEPETLFSECARVLKPNGVVCLATPNAYGYPALAARMIPNRWHASVLKMLGTPRESHDVFPTFYRCNTVRKLKSMMQSHGFEAHAYPYAGEPGYLGFSKITYFLGVQFHRFAPRALMPCLFAFGWKPATIEAIEEQPVRPLRFRPSQTKRLKSEPLSKAA
jgi:SAM-dependent methyltransferase